MRGRGAARRDEFVSRVERFVPDGAQPVSLELAEGRRRLQAFLHFDGELLRAEGPGRPRVGERATFYVVRATGRGTRFIAVLEPLGDSGVVRGVRAHGGVIEVDTVQGTHRHTATPGGWEVATTPGRVRLAGGREPEPPFAPCSSSIADARDRGARASPKPPPLDGTLDGFDTSEPLRLELEDQYRRSEEAIPVPRTSPPGLRRVGRRRLYLAVDVTKARPVLPAGGGASAAARQRARRRPFGRRAGACGEGTREGGRGTRASGT